MGLHPVLQSCSDRCAQICNDEHLGPQATLHRARIGRSGPAQPSPCVCACTISPDRRPCHWAALGTRPQGGGKHFEERMRAATGLHAGCRGHGHGEYWRGAVRGVHCVGAVVRDRCMRDGWVQGMRDAHMERSCVHVGRCSELCRWSILERASTHLALYGYPHGYPHAGRGRDAEHAGKCVWLG